MSVVVYAAASAYWPNSIIVVIVTLEADQSQLNLRNLPSNNHQSVLTSTQSIIDFGQNLNDAKNRKAAESFSSSSPEIHMIISYRT